MPRQRKTITCRDLEKLAESGLTIVLKRGSHPKRYCGLHFPALDEIRIYLPGHGSRREITLTILHECYHALEGSNGFEKDLQDKEINSIAERSLESRPEIGNFIKELYSLKY